MFRKILIAFILIVACAFLLPRFYTIAQVKKNTAKEVYQNGDIIIQSSKSRQCEAVKYATHSDISHCGILFEEEGKWYVWEAVEPVSKIPLASFINRGTGQHYTVKRLKENQLLTDRHTAKMRSAGNALLGKHYDIYFNWSDAEIYCSELVWKLYREAGVALCKTRKLRDFDLSHPLVITMMKERYGEKIPYEEEVIAPSDIYASPLLETVDKR